MLFGLYEMNILIKTPSKSHEGYKNERLFCIITD